MSSKRVSLNARYRSGIGRSAVRSVRNAGRVPAVMYGGPSPQSLDLDGREIANALNRSSTMHLLVDLNVTDGEKSGKRLALIQDIQKDPLRDTLLHVDFHEINEKQKINIEVPVVPLGEPLGVRTQGGVLDQPIHSLEVECLPKDLPDLIEVDINHLELEGAITVADIKLPEGVEALTPADLTVFIVHTPRVSDESAPVSTEAAGQPEVINEKKDKEEPAAKGEKGGAKAAEKGGGDKGGKK